jgi:hypothetical protein
MIKNKTKSKVNNEINLIVLIGLSFIVVLNIVAFALMPR